MHFRFGIAVAALAVLLAACTHRDQRSLAGPIDVTTTPSEIKFQRPIWAKLDFSEVLFETNVWPQDLKHSPQSFAEEAGFKASLVRDDGSKVPLSLSFANQFVSASTSTIQWQKVKQGPFTALEIVSAKPIHFQRIIWLSCNPPETKTGMCEEVAKGLGARPDNIPLEPTAAPRESK